MKTQSFSLAVDGSSNSDVKKMNPLTVKIVDVSQGVVNTQFLDMCMSSVSTAELRWMMYLLSIMYPGIIVLELAYL